MAEKIRPPVVTILGHIDHGKTTLLDFIRRSSVASREYGGITQAIGAYQVEVGDKTITFIDTPGHAAFEKMRSRGAQVADIAVLVVAVDDGVMPQTVEAIKHVHSAGIPAIVAINKIDLLGINLQVQTDKIKKQLSDQKILVEEYGGDTPVVLVSAKTGQGVRELLETINLVAEIHEFKGDSDKPASGVILESRLDKFRGPIATVLVRDGSLGKGDLVKAGGASGKVRGMFDFTGKVLFVARPSVPVEVLGFATVPAVGARLGEEAAEKVRKTEIGGLIEKLREEKSQILNVLIRADKEGSLEAVEEAVKKFNEEKEHIRIISSGTGDISGSDVELADTTSGIILGFNVNIAPTAKKIAETERVLIRTYHVIYELTEELGEVVENMLKPGRVEEVFGRAQIIAEFPYGKGERIAGCKVLEGALAKGPRVRTVREGEIIGEAKIKSLKKVKEEVNKVEKGGECGIIFDPSLDFQIGDLVESFRAF